MKKRRKSAAEIEQDIAAFRNGDASLYWPGGAGGGDNRKRLKGTAPVVRPTHARRRCVTTEAPSSTSSSIKRQRS
jgi:hypothetical protein